MSTPANATLVVHEISKSFQREHGRENKVISAMSLEVSPGSLVVIEGDFGSGRSTLLRCLFGTYRVDYGSVQLQCEAGSVELTTTSDRTMAW